MKDQIERKAAIDKDTNVPSNDCISRQAAIEVLNKLARDNFTLNNAFAFYLGALHDAADGIKALPAAQPELKLYANMSDTEFEEWLHAHGICNPNIHESIPCDAVPLLIDNAISELLSAQPTQTNAEATQKCVGTTQDCVSRPAAIDKDTNVPSND